MRLRFVSVLYKCDWYVLVEVLLKTDNLVGVLRATVNLVEIMHGSNYQVSISITIYCFYLKDYAVTLLKLCYTFNGCVKGEDIWLNWNFVKI